MCHHANENPNVCSCPQECECRLTMCKDKINRASQRLPDTPEAGTRLHAPHCDFVFYGPNMDCDCGMKPRRATTVTEARIQRQREVNRLMTNDLSRGLAEKQERAAKDIHQMTLQNAANLPHSEPHFQATCVRCAARAQLSWADSAPFFEEDKARRRLDSPQARLRDEFARAALPEVVNTGGSYEEDAREAYRYADAMMREREK